ncbi:MAG: hypothetical protein H7Z42_01925 [Roseiflexaceae bacterium]|nr:hypothetical protein [Roseiflexaceae bacterium]
MRLLGWLLNLALVCGAALVGNYVGDFVRDPHKQRGNSDVGFVRGQINGNNVIGLNVRLTNLLPALILAWLAGPPRVVAAFLGGMATSALVGDALEP